jgi:hypothetical protein
MKKFAEWLKEIRSAPRCGECRGTGLRWAWWTYLITLPLQMMIEVLSALLPFVILIGLLLAGLSVYSAKFTILFYFFCAVAAFILLYYGMKMVFPRCSECSGRGFIKLEG